MYLDRSLRDVYYSTFVFRPACSCLTLSMDSRATRTIRSPIARKSKLLRPEFSSRVSLIAAGGCDWCD